MHVVRHQEIAEDLKAISFPCFFQDLLEGVAGGWGPEDVGVAIAAYGDEVKVAGLMVSSKTFGHCQSLEESGLASRDNPPFARRPQRMGHPAFGGHPVFGGQSVSRILGGCFLGDDPVAVARWLAGDEEAGWGGASVRG